VVFLGANLPLVNSHFSVFGESGTFGWHLFILYSDFF
jgi:hypothetical protein